MIASVHIADLGAGSALGVVRKAPKPDSTPGLRHANVGMAAPLSASALPKPAIGRVGLVAFWDDDAALDHFLAEHPMAAKLAGGWHVRLEPLRAFGSWPGLPEEIPSSRAVASEGPVAVLTMGRLRTTQAVRFFRTSAKAEGAAIVAPGFLWATGLARPPFVATCSLWESASASAEYAFGQSQPGHPGAIATDRAKPFHHQSAFVRFRPYDAQGSLGGKNPLSETVLPTG